MSVISTRSPGLALDRSPCAGSIWITLPACSICRLACWNGVTVISPPVAGTVFCAAATAGKRPIVNTRAAAFMRVLLRLDILSHCIGLGIGFHETHEPLAFVLERPASAPVELAERLEHQANVTLFRSDLVLDRPQARDGTVNEEGGGNEGITGEELLPVVIVNDSAAIGVRPKHVVIFAQKSSPGVLITIRKRGPPQNREHIP